MLDKIRYLAESKGSICLWLIPSRRTSVVGRLVCVPSEKPAYRTAALYTVVVCIFSNEESNQLIYAHEGVKFFFTSWKSVLE